MTAADKGITGTSTKKREGFNRMIQDALAGKIDLIITKSVSRFARNTVDTLTTIRKLKEHGVEVYFEEQNIYTMDGKGEVLLTIMSSIAQEESRNISEHVTWGMRKRFADGKVSMDLPTEEAVPMNIRDFPRISFPPVSLRSICVSSNRASISSRYFNAQLSGSLCSSRYAYIFTRAFVCGSAL